MALIVVIWALIFYPQSLKHSQNKISDQFLNLKNRVNSAVSIFKTETPAAKIDQPKTEEDVQELRARVFGDSIKRS